MGILSDVWLTEDLYMDLVARRAGNGIVNFQEMMLVGRHWLEATSKWIKTNTAQGPILMR